MKHHMLGHEDLQRWLMLWRMQLVMMTSSPNHVQLRLETPQAWAVGLSTGAAPSMFAAFDNALSGYMRIASTLPREKRWPAHLQHEVA